MGNCLKRGAWTVCQFKGRLGKKEGVVFLRGEGGVDTPMHTKFKCKCKFLPANFSVSAKCSPSGPPSCFLAKA